MTPQTWTAIKLITLAALALPAYAGVFLLLVWLFGEDTAEAIHRHLPFVAIALAALLAGGYGNLRRHLTRREKPDCDQ